MYTEIRELVNFLARYFHLRVPRLKIGAFCEQLANNCLFRFQPYWNINQPKQHEEQRIIRISRAFCDKNFTSAANSVGVLLEELFNCLPDQLILYVNPGEVFYCSSDYSPPVPIWIGSVNEDLSYNDEQMAANPLVPPQPLPSTILPTMSSFIQPLNSLFAMQPTRSTATTTSAMNLNAANANFMGLFNQSANLSATSPTGQQNAAYLIASKNCLGADSAQSVDFSVLEWRIPLTLVHPRELGYEFTNPYTGFTMFRFVVPGTPKFTVETFAITRFGSYRKRPDHKKQFVEAVKDFVNNSPSLLGVASTLNNSSSLLGVASAQSNSATTTTSSGDGNNNNLRAIWDNDKLEGAFWNLNLGI